MLGSFRYQGTRSDDPNDLQEDLQALAGPSAGPSGGSIFIDGFSGGDLPAKSSIREIRINQNPFSPEYDKLGYGRIEIFTKPGNYDFAGLLTSPTTTLEFHLNKSLPPSPADGRELGIILRSIGLYPR